MARLSKEILLQRKQLLDDLINSGERSRIQLAQKVKNEPCFQGYKFVSILTFLNRYFSEKGLTAHHAARPDGIVVEKRKQTVRDLYNKGITNGRGIAREIEGHALFQGMKKNSIYFFVWYTLKEAGLKSERERRSTSSV